MPVRRKQCESCPFRQRMDDAELAGLVAVPPGYWPCHKEDGPSGQDSGVQCRGHWGARRRYANRHGQAEVDRLTAKWHPEVDLKEIA